MWAMGFEPKTKSLSIVDSTSLATVVLPKMAYWTPVLDYKWTTRWATAKTYCNTELTFRIG